MPRQYSSQGRFVRLGEQQRKTVRFELNGKPAVAFEGDTVLTAVLTAIENIRQSEFGDGGRAGFCLMGACQDCWVWLCGGQRLRACTTEIAEGMQILTELDKVSWPISA